MDRKVFNEWLRKKQVIEANGKAHSRVLFCDNCGVHDFKPETITSVPNFKT